MNPHKAPLDLWREKIGEVPRFEGNARTRWGLDAEIALRKWYADEVGGAIWVPPASFYHPEVEWCRGTPDGIVLRDPAGEPMSQRNWDHGFEAKNVGRFSADRWGEPGTDEVPAEYLVQAQQNMAVTGLGLWVLVASIGGEPPTIYRVERDDELIADLIDQGGEFWRCVLTRTPPPIDGSGAWADYLAERYPFLRDDYVEAGEELEDAIHSLMVARSGRRQVDDLIAMLENRIKAAIGSAAGIKSAHGRITWKPSKARKLVNWEAVALALAADAETPPPVVEQFVAQYTTTAKQPRPFNCPRSWSRE